MTIYHTTNHNISLIAMAKRRKKKKIVLSNCVICDDSKLKKKVQSYRLRGKSVKFIANKLSLSEDLVQDHVDGKCLVTDDGTTSATVKAYRNTVNTFLHDIKKARENYREDPRKGSFAYSDMVNTLNRSMQTLDGVRDPETMHREVELTILNPMLEGMARILINEGKEARNSLPENYRTVIDNLLEKAAAEMQGFVNAASEKFLDYFNGKDV